ncbi:MAG: chemotaxis protein CheW [Methylobacter sp.]|nr:MAG: chemotaxis protein CheW [Methylobacter sp.]
MDQEQSGLDKILSLRHDASAKIVNVDEPIVKLVIFELDGEWFAFSGESISEIMSAVEVFFVPGCPPSLEGVINVRGNIESVIRLAELLGKPATDPAPSSSILRGQGGGMHSGIRVDRVVDVLDVVQSAIQPPPTTLPEHMRRIVSGLIRHQDTPVAILDLDRLFEDYQRGQG